MSDTMQCDHFVTRTIYCRSINVCGHYLWKFC